jgi:hypothetical protein
MLGWELEISNCKATLWSPLSSRDSEFVAHTTPHEKGHGRSLVRLYIHGY